MFTIITYKSQFGIDLNTIVDGDSSETGLIYDKLRLEQFLTAFDKRIDEDNLQFLESVKNEEEEIRLSMLSQFDIDNSLYYFKDILLKSIFIASYSMFENRLIKTCEICTQHNQIVPYKTFRKKKGRLSEIEIAVDYLATEMKISTNALFKDLDIILKYKEIRKALVHYGSMIDESKKDGFLPKDNGLEINDGIISITERKFVESFIDLSCDFISRLIEIMNIQLELIEK